MTETTNPTVAEWTVMLAEYATAADAYTTSEHYHAPEEEARARRASAALENARPTDPVVMVMQLGWLVRGTELEDNPALVHIAKQLGAMATPAPSGQLANLWHEYRELGQRIAEAENDVPDEVLDHATERQAEIAGQLAEARPVSLVDLAIQARVLTDWVQEPRNQALARSIAEQLEQMAGRVQA